MNIGIYLTVVLGSCKNILNFTLECRWVKIDLYESKRFKHTLLSWGICVWKLLLTYLYLQISNLQNIFLRKLSWRLKSPASRLFAQSFIQAQIKENIKSPRHWPVCGNSPVIGEFSAQRVSNAVNVSIWWRHRNSYQCWDVFRQVMYVYVYTYIYEREIQGGFYDS